MTERIPMTMEELDKYFDAWRLINRYDNDWKIRARTHGRWRSSGCNEINAIGGGCTHSVKGMPCGMPDEEEQNVYMNWWDTRWEKRNLCKEKIGD
jgi:hypothetical protein